MDADAYDTSETDANANLIASAPEMLDMLKELRFALNKDYYYEEFVRNLDGLIDKAEGEIK